MAAMLLFLREMEDPGDWKTEDLVQVGTLLNLKFQETDNGSAQVFASFYRGLSENR